MISRLTSGTSPTTAPSASAVTSGDAAKLSNSSSQSPVSARKGLDVPASPWHETNNQNGRLASSNRLSDGPTRPADLLPAAPNRDGLTFPNPISAFIRRTTERPEPRPAAARVMLPFAPSATCYMCDAPIEPFELYFVVTELDGQPVTFSHARCDDEARR